ncbi:glucuronate isomerase [Salinicoccus sediminis]|uniref:Uronate isomerase n=1 Tax=Salinicoccus sediminis TaxID=1432562 RepID=A0A0M2SL14_9STAP|nr:glucuronate isomerase [Salinicoccus sediminis]KKK34923.1 glucuronate isomerase [Salinicoccus sediminis]
MIDKDFLLTTNTAKWLFHDVAAHLPIVDYHNHLNPKEIYDNENYESITDVWLGGDHYKWRAMRAAGIDEERITGGADEKAKFDAFAETMPKLFGNQLLHWTQLELRTFFGIERFLSQESADEIYEQTNAALKEEALRPRNILSRQKVKFLGTTDDPTDSLEYHRLLKEDETFDVHVAPSFRPDKAIAIDAPDYAEWLGRLEAAVDFKVDSYGKFMEAMKKRIEFFDGMGCRASDHGINEMFYEEATEDEMEEVFDKVLSEEAVSRTEVDKFKTHTLISLAKEYHARGWVMQLHIGPLRNNNTRMFDRTGPDSGFDSINDKLVAEPLSRFLDAIDRTDELPKTVLYTLNPRDNIIMATMAGNFQSGDIPGKVQFGTAWWFNDNYDGMMDQMKTLANAGAFKTFIGMLTDSRSMLSFTRHEYFRRILCELLGQWAESGMIPDDRALLKEYVEDICYNNAKNYFGLEN